MSWYRVHQSLPLTMITTARRWPIRWIKITTKNMRLSPCNVCRRTSHSMMKRVLIRLKKIYIWLAKIAMASIDLNKENLTKQIHLITQDNVTIAKSTKRSPWLTDVWTALKARTNLTSASIAKSRVLCADRLRQKQIGIATTNLTLLSKKSKKIKVALQWLKY